MALPEFLAFAMPPEALNAVVKEDTAHREQLMVSLVWSMHSGGCVSSVVAASARSFGRTSPTSPGSALRTLFLPACVAPLPALPPPWGPG